DPEVQVTCLARGAADFLQRPLDGRVLLARVDRAIREARDRRRLESAAQTDGLTGLANFRALDSRLREELERARRYRYPLAMAMIDVDYLKDVNDRFGHAAGNHVLAAFARRLTRNLRGTDFAARYGGDEFAVLLAHQTWREAAVFCERLRTSLLSRPISPSRSDSGKHLVTVIASPTSTSTAPSSTPTLEPTTISVGVAAHAPGSSKSSGEALLRAADAALYEAKHRGRNQVVIFERDLQTTSEGASRGH
ncbi:MAG TPA: diguanylate cyclase, partial [Myxococcales bacterium]|nr:diguanylate cyclase [Myxococcales bacterium]